MMTIYYLCATWPHFVVHTYISVHLKIAVLRFYIYLALKRYDDTFRHIGMRNKCNIRDAIFQYCIHALSTDVLFEWPHLFRQVGPTTTRNIAHVLEFDRLLWHMQHSTLYVWVAG